MEYAPLEITEGRNKGCYLHNHVGKYKSNLVIITLQTELPWRSISPDVYNLNPQGKYHVLYGDYRISRKCTKIFDTTVHNPKHVLIRDDWGGAFNTYNGYSLPRPDKNSESVYFRRASSNGGGSGYDYAIMPINWRQAVSVEEI